MPAQPTPTAIVRARVMEGLVDAVADKGYAAVTISDIVHHAQVSKSTFYAHFADKEQCFLAAYTDAAEQVLDVVAASARIDATDDARVLAATEAYLTVTSQDPRVTRTFIHEVLAAGPAALQMRHDVNRRFADLLRQLVGERADPAQGALSAPAALIVVGGINELVLSAVVEDRIESLPELAPTVSRIVLAAVDAQAP
jgi:AcrR family transcriptional regulator